MSLEHRFILCLTAPPPRLPHSPCLEPLGSLARAAFVHPSPVVAPMCAAEEGGVRANGRAARSRWTPCCVPSSARKKSRGLTAAWPCVPGRESKHRHARHRGEPVSPRARFITPAQLQLYDFAQAAMWSIWMRQ